MTNKETYIISTHEPYRAWAIKKIFDELGLHYSVETHDHYYEDGYGGFEVREYWKYGAYVTKEQLKMIRYKIKKLDYPMSSEYREYTKDFKIFESRREMGCFSM